MGRRIVSSHERAAGGKGGAKRKSRAVASRAVSTDAQVTPPPRAGRAVASLADGRRVVRSARSGANGGSGGDSIRRGFVDVRRMPSEDAVSKTLDETSGVLGLPVRPKVVDFGARLKERRRMGMRVVAVRVASVVAVLAAVCALAWFLFLSPVFRLETAQISVSGGNAWVSRSDILAIAGKQSGKSLFLVSSDEVVSQLKNIPGVTEATVGKQFPKSLTVTVKAQQPAAMLKGSSSGLVAVDSKGRVLNTVGDASTAGIPVIEVKDVSSSLDNKAIKEALKVLGGLSGTMRGQITKVTASTQDSITTELNGGEHVVVWGDSSDLELKKAIVDKILSDPNVIGDKTQVDVSAPSRPIIK